MVRPARFSDIRKIVALLDVCLATSKYAQTADFDRDLAKSTLYGLIAQHEPQAKPMDTAVFVATDGEEITGLIAGMLTPAYLLLSEMTVTDMFWFVDPDRVAPKDGAALLAALHEWADTFDGPVRRVHSTNNTHVDPRVTGRMYRMSGFQKVGEVFEKGSQT